MKFGILSFSYAGFRNFETSRNESGFYTTNLGDNTQTIASRRLYQRLGIHDKDIVAIDRDSLPQYSGDPAVLLMNGAFSGRSFPIPKSITPLFLGFSVGASVVRQHRDFFQHNAPIGCRDVATMLVMLDHGIEAYVSGCVTMTFAPRAVVPAPERLFIVYGARAGELPSSVLTCIPPHLLRTAVFIDHRLPVGELPLTQASCDWITRYEVSLLQRYRSEAMLVLTPLLHVASPCLAMKIPVVIARKDDDSRFSLIKTILPVHTPENFGDIDWTPATPGCSEIAELFVKKVSEFLHKARLRGDALDTGGAE